MSFTHVQGVATNAAISGGNTLSITFGSALTTGNTVVGAIKAVPNGITISSISDGTNTYVQKDSLASNGSKEYFTFELGNITGGQTTITVTFGSGSGNPAEAVADEYSGAIAAADPTDGHAIVQRLSPGTGTNAITSSSITTTVNGDLIYGVVFDEGHSTPIPSAGTSPLTFTGRESNSDTGDGTLVFSEDAVQTTAGSVNTAFTDATNGGTDTFIVTVMAIKPAAGAAANPILNFDWPIPTRTNWYMHEQNRLHIPNPTLINRLNNWPNPYPVTWYQSCTLSLAQLLPAPQIINRNNDWPNPRTYIPTPIDQFYEFGNVQFLVLQPASYFHNYDFPNPQPIQWYRSWEIGRAQSLPAPNIINRLNDWPLPQPVTWYRDWFQNLLSSTLGVVQSPFRQNDWPNPKSVTWYKDWSQILVQFLPAPQVINTNQDWPNPQPVYWYRDYNQNVVITIPAQAPFNQIDWPNPQPLTWFRDHNQNLVIYLPSSVPPFNQYDWPVPKTPQPIDQFWAQTLALTIPPLPPPSVITSSGHQWTEADVLRSWMAAIGKKGRAVRYAP